MAKKTEGVVLVANRRARRVTGHSWYGDGGYFVREMHNAVSVEIPVSLREIGVGDHVSILEVIALVLDNKVDITLR